MEADWEFEVGGDAPVIEGQWPGFIDLRSSPERAVQLPEATQLTALAEALEKLNLPTSPVWTSKCDFWPQLESDAFDSDELDASPGSAACAMGCYIDLLPRDGQQWAQPTIAEAVCKRVCSLLRAVPLGCSRADLVIRRAFITADRMDLGITAYLSSCGPSSAEAEWTLAAALTALTDALGSHSTLE